MSVGSSVTLHPTVFLIIFDWLDWLSLSESLPWPLAETVAVCLLGSEFFSPAYGRGSIRRPPNWERLGLLEILDEVPYFFREFWLWP